MKKNTQQETKLFGQLMDSLLWLWVMLSPFGLWFSLSRAEITGWSAREYPRVPAHWVFHDDHTGHGTAS